LPAVALLRPGGDAQWRSRASATPTAPGGGALQSGKRPEECVLETRKPGPIYLVMAMFGFLFIAFGLFWDAMAG
jgi:hypothetical protein